MSKLFINKNFNLGTEALDIDKINSFATQGELVLEGGNVVVSKLQIGATMCFIKKYSYTPSFQFLGRRSYAFNEQHAYNCFTKMGIAHPQVVFCAEKRQFGRLSWSILATQAVEESQDMVTFLIPCEDQELRKRLFLQVAEMTALMYKRRFSHGGWRMRNILVNKEHELFCIDCPKGHFKKTPFGRSPNTDLLSIYRDFMQIASEEEKVLFIESYCQKTNRDANMWKKNIAQMCLQKYKRIKPLKQGQAMIFLEDLQQ